MTKNEHDYIEIIKIVMLIMLPCACCDSLPPNDFHHVKEGDRRVGHHLGMPLCRTCHDQVYSGPMWRIHKMTMLKALEKTNRMLLSALHSAIHSRIF